MLGQRIAHRRISAGVEKTLFIASERKPCTGVATMECLQVRESPPTDRRCAGRW